MKQMNYNTIKIKTVRNKSKLKKASKTNIES